MTSNTTSNGDTDGCLDELQALALASGGLDQVARAQVHRHVDGCPACTRYVAALAATLPEETTDVRYELRGTLGVGGFGVVFEAWDRKLRRLVAIKLLEGADQRAERALRHEAQALARLRHPNVIDVFDVGRLDGELFIAMELCAAGSMRQWLDAEREPEAIVERFSAAGRGLIAAHEVGLIHGDLKADNVLLCADGRVVVSDFGLAQAQQSESTDSRSDRAGCDETGVAGTPSHLAPEVAAGNTKSQASDQFAFGIALDLALGGRGPAHVRKAVARMLRPDPRQRFSSMAEVLDALQPRGRRWSRAVGGLAAVAFATTVAITVSDDPCEQPPVHDHDLDALASQFTRIDPDHGARWWSATERALEDYVASWRAQKNAVCGEASVAEQQSGLECLERRWDALQTQLGVLASIEPTQLHRAPRAIRELSDALHCRDAEGPAAPGASEAWEARYDRIVTRVLFDDLESSIASLQQLRDEAHRHGWAHAEGRALLSLGSVTQSVGKPDLARQHFEAAALAGETIGADDLVVRGWSRCVMSAIIAGTLESAHEAIRFARAYAERSSGRHDVFAAAIAESEGALAQAEGRYGDAIRSFELALNLADDELRRAHLERDLASVLLVAGRVAEAAEHARASLEAFESVAPDAHDRIAVFELLAKIAAHQQDHGEAERWGTRLLDEIAAAHLDDGLNFAIALNSRGVSRLRAGHLDDARADLELAVQRYAAAVGPTSPATGNGLYALGMLEHEAGRPSFALHHLDEALVLARQSGNPHFEGTVQLGRCTVLHGLDDPAATRSCEAALAALRAVLGEDHPDVEAARRLATAAPAR